MIDSQLLGTLKRKELVELAASKRWSGWTRLSKADLLEFVRAKLSAESAESTAAESAASATPDVQVEPAAPQEASAAVANDKKPRARRARKSASESPTPLFDVLQPAPAPAAAPPEKPKRGRPKRAKKEQEEVATAQDAPQDEPKPAKRARKSRAKKAEEPTATAPTEPTAQTEPTATIDPPAPTEPVKKMRRPYTRRAKTQAEPTPATVESTPSPVAHEPTEASTSESAKPEKPKRPRARRAKRDETTNARQEERRKTEQSEEQTPSDEPTVGDNESGEARDERRANSSLDVRTEELITPDERETRENARRQIFQTSREKVDRLLLIVCDPHWLRACWETSDALLERVRSAMGRHWHTADPVLRVYRVEKEANGSTIRREQVADVVVRLELANWYVQVDDPPQHFMVELGYLARDGQFFTLVSSNLVTTPQRYVHDAFSRPVLNPMAQGFESNSFYGGSRIGRPRVDGELPLPGKRRSLDSNLEFVQPIVDPDGRGGARLTDDFTPYEEKLTLSVDAEVVIRGKVSEGATVKVKEEPILVNSEGAFAVRFSLPERRHVYPVVATTGDGSETRTIIIAIDRNTKTLDPVFREDVD